ncbi:unnamed protein product [Paramecium octaurelia]|uniref:Uncharacterized protein n=1 Tax=Paramecium octaurelia TaxID=43137 RepID=A0A8S1XFC8_PAROT|nr:unnamed protein product [Paramecium octaurelia]
MQHLELLKILLLYCIPILNDRKRDQIVKHSTPLSNINTQNSQYYPSIIEIPFQAEY